MSVGNGAPLFESRCRRPGTRCNAIMTLIEQGVSEKEIADRFHTDRNTIRVYRKALNGELSNGSERAALMEEEREKKQKTVTALKNEGMKVRQICEITGLSDSVVRTLLGKKRDRHRKYQKLMEIFGGGLQEAGDKEPGG